jgi:predicted nucleic acid-binding protein
MCYMHQREGISLSDYLRRELQLLTRQLTWEELFEEVVDLLIKPPAELAHLRARLTGERIGHVPHLLDVEVTDALRRRLLAGRLTELSARRALRDLAVMGLIRWPHRALLGRALALRDQLTAYDAIYVAMAEVTGATLLTRDARLALPTGHRARIELV